MTAVIYWPLFALSINSTGGQFIHTESLIKVDCGCRLTVITKVPWGAVITAAGVECVKVNSPSTRETVASWLANTSLTASMTVSTATRRYVLIVSQWTVAHTVSKIKCAWRVSLHVVSQKMNWSWSFTTKIFWAQKWWWLIIYIGVNSLKIKLLIVLTILTIYDI